MEIEGQIKRQNKRDFKQIRSFSKQIIKNTENINKWFFKKIQNILFLLFNSSIDLDIVKLDQQQFNAKCFLESSDTKILCSIQGPYHIPGQRLQLQSIECDLKVNINFLCIEDEKDKFGRVKNTNKNVLLIERLLEVFKSVIIMDSYKKSHISINFEVIEHNGSIFSHLCNLAAVTISLAGIMSLGFITSIQCVIDQQNRVIIDPDTEEEKNSKANLNVVVQGNSARIIYFYLTGEQDKKDTEQLFSHCVGASQRLSENTKQIIKELMNLD